MTEEEKKAIKWLKELYDIEKDFNSSAGKEESNTIKTLLNLIIKQQKETEKYKRYFKLAISDIQDEGYMDMPYEEIEEYYSKRKDIV